MNIEKIAKKLQPLMPHKVSQWIRAFNKSDDYDQFLEKRANIIIAKIDELTNLRPTSICLGTFSWSIAPAQDKFM